VEGLGSVEDLHPLQAAFRQAHALQCGFCTPGILMTLVPFLGEHPNPAESEIREALSGNLCRCTGYQNIVDAAKLARPGPLPVPPPPIPGLVFHACTQVPLVKDKARHVGEPIAMVVAESRYVAEDAVADIVVDVAPLQAVVDLEAALERGAPLVHEHLFS